MTDADRKNERGTMDLSEIEKLAHVHGDPAVSILCRLDRRRPGNLEDPLRLEALRSRAGELVRESAEPARAAALAARVDDAVAAVDLAHPGDGVAVLVTAEDSHVLPLPFAVRDRVVVDATFATRELIEAARRSLHARVLVLAAEDARCFEAVGSSLRELHGHGFPLHLSPPVQEDTPKRDLPIGEREQAEAHRTVVRRVDEALAALQHADHLPLVVVATVRELAYFEEVTRFRADVVGRVHGNHVGDALEDVERVVAPALAEAASRRAAAAVTRAQEALGTAAAVGIEEVETAATAGRGHELIVEENLRVDAARPAGADDPVDRVMRAVLAQGGTVTTVPDGALADRDGIVLVLRY
jgi:hypothetical protein